MKLSAYPSPNTDYQELTRNYPCIIRVLSVSYPSPSLTTNYKTYGFCIVNMVFTHQKHGVYES